MQFHDTLIHVKKFLEEAGIEDAARETELIIAHVLATDRAALYRDNPIVPSTKLRRIHAFLKRRSKREPLQYIIGSVEFLGLTLTVGPGVLIPRPETEFMVDETAQMLRRIKHKDDINIVDLCTGTGCIALSMAKIFPNAKVYGTDTSKIAVRYAKKNAVLNNIDNVRFIKTSLFGRLSDESFDLVISNPPYIKHMDIKYLQPEITGWEPLGALDGGIDGLEYYRSIIPEALRYLKSGGFLVLEIGYDQAYAVNTMAESSGYSDISFIKDYAGIKRIFVGKKAE